MIRNLFLCALASTLLACGGARVISATDMMAEDAANNPAPKPVVDDWKETWAELGTEFELVQPGKAKLQGTELIVSIIKTGWSSFETSSGESRTGWAQLLFTRGEEYKSVRIEEEDFGFALGYKVQVNYAYEKWNETRSLYDPHVKLVLTKQ